jgi:hypothetical protein
LGEQGVCGGIAEKVDMEGGIALPSVLDVKHLARLLRRHAKAHNEAAVTSQPTISTSKRARPHQRCAALGSKARSTA